MISWILVKGTGRNNDYYIHRSILHGSRSLRKMRSRMQDRKIRCINELVWNDQKNSQNNVGLKSMQLNSVGIC